MSLLCFSCLKGEPPSLQAWDMENVGLVKAEQEAASANTDNRNTYHPVLYNLINNR